MASSKKKSKPEDMKGYVQSVLSDAMSGMDDENSGPGLKTSGKNINIFIMGGMGEGGPAAMMAKHSGAGGPMPKMPKVKGDPSIMGGMPPWDYEPSGPLEMHPGVGLLLSLEKTKPSGPKGKKKGKK